MALDSHIHQLEIRHRELEVRLEETRHHPSVDDAEIAEIKRQKLLIKDRIAELKQQANLH